MREKHYIVIDKHGCYDPANRLRNKSQPGVCCSRSKAGQAGAQQQGLFNEGKSSGGGRTSWILRVPGTTTSRPESDGECLSVAFFFSTAPPQASRAGVWPACMYQYSCDGTELNLHCVHVGLAHERVRLLTLRSSAHAR